MHGTVHGQLDRCVHVVRAMDADQVWNVGDNVHQAIEMNGIFLKQKLFSHFKVIDGDK